MSDILSTFPEGDPDEDGLNCTVCAEYGACRDWIEAMACDANVPAEWLAERVQAGHIDHDNSVDDVRYYYQHHIDLAEYYE